MRQRHYRARVWLNEEEYNQFIRNVNTTGLSKETYLRQLINGYYPKSIPTNEYFAIIRKLEFLYSQSPVLLNCDHSICHTTSLRFRECLIDVIKSLQYVFELP
jgi:hypothetical protein